MASNNQTLTPKQLDAFMESQRQQVAIQQQQLDVQSQQIALQENQIEIQKLDITTNKEIALATIAAQKENAINETNASKSVVTRCIVGALIFSALAFFYHKGDLIMTLIALAGAFVGGMGWNVTKGK